MTLATPHGVRRARQVATWVGAALVKGAMVWGLVVSLGGDAVAQQVAAPPPSSTPQTAAQPAAKPAAKAPAARDRLELAPTTITGNRELPGVTYVVPWKRADLGDLSGKPANSLLDEVLAPVDRDVFRREIGYFRALSLDRTAPPAEAEKPVTPAPDRK